MGSFHLTNTKPKRIENTVADIGAMKTVYIVPAHCTGFEVIVAFSKEMPDAFRTDTSGTK